MVRPCLKNTKQNKKDKTRKADHGKVVRWKTGGSSVRERQRRHLGAKRSNRVVRSLNNKCRHRRYQGDPEVSLARVGWNTFVIDRHNCQSEASYLFQLGRGARVAIRE